MNTFAPTSQQAEALDLLLEFATSKETDDGAFLLEGYAGSGKSSLFWMFYEQLISGGKNYKVAVTSCTNKAVSVVENMAPKKYRSQVEFLTIHSLLGVTVEINDDGREIFKPSKRRDRQSSFGAFQLVLVDECSMVNEELWGLLQEAMGRHINVKVILMGDPAQLPPVGEEISPAFTNVTKRYCLTQIVRYVAEQPIGRLVGVVRDWIIRGEQTQSFKYAVNVIALDSSWDNTKDNQVFSLSDHDWIETVISMFKSHSYQQDPDFVRCLCWTNKAVNYLNTLIRKAVYGETAIPFVEGERLITIKPVFLYDNLVLPTSSEITVVSCKEHKHDEYDYAGYYITVNAPPHGGNMTFFVVKDSDKAKWEAQCNILKENALKRSITTRKEAWVEYYNHVHISAPVTYAYALTTHRAQGSTFDNVFVSHRDIMRNPRQVERLKCLYVSLTRARSGVYLCGVK